MADDYEKIGDPEDQHTEEAENGNTETSKPKKLTITDIIAEHGENALCTCSCLPKRYLTMILLFLGLISMHAMRVNVSVTVVTILGQDPYNKVETIHELPHVDWDSQMVGFLHSIFYIGYLVTQIPSGLLITRAGFAGHRIFGLSILLSSCLNLLLPLAIDDVGYAFTCFVRFMQGLCEGMSFPGLYAVLQHWTTPGERGRLGGMAITGVYSGAILGYPVAGLLTHYINWQSVYYSNGALGILWAIVWMLFSFEKPDLHPSISNQELEHFQKNNSYSGSSVQINHVPWKRILTSLPLMATAVSHFARSWVFYMLLTNQPTYFDVFGFSLAQNGALSSIPHVLMVLFSACSGPFADLLMSWPQLSVTKVRKIMNTTGFGVECICMAALGFVTDGTAAVVFMSIGAGFSGLCVSGWQINHLDLAPQYSSILVSITSLFGVTAGVASPLVIGAITTHQTIQEWHIVFLIIATILFVATVVFLLFGSGEKQDWAEPTDGNTQVLVTSDPFEDKPYGTFKQQTECSEELQQMKSNNDDEVGTNPDDDGLEDKTSKFS